jgi:hypothetical protein
MAMVAGATWLVFVVLVVRGTSAPQLLATPARSPAAIAAHLDMPEFTGSLQVIQSQSLVYSSRSFREKPAVDVSRIPPRPDYRLAGVIILPRKPAVALLVRNQGDESRRVKQGETLDGWTVQSVDRKRVVLGFENERFELGAQNSPVESAAVQQATVGLKRVPLRSQVASAGSGGRVLSATGTPGGARATAQLSNEPRLYRPPPAAVPQPVPVDSQERFH